MIPSSLYLRSSRITSGVQVDDFGMIDYFKLAVSERVLTLLKTYDVSDMKILRLEVDSLS